MRRMTGRLGKSLRLAAFAAGTQGACGTDSDGAPAIPEDVVAFTENAHAVDAMYCDVRFPDRTSRGYEVCPNLSHFHVVSFPGGAGPCYPAIARDDLHFRESFRTLAACLTPIYDDAVGCLQAANSPEAADVCLEAFEVAAEPCAETESAQALFDERAKCGRCEKMEPIPALWVMPTYCLDDLLED